MASWAERAEGTPVSEKVRSAMRRKAVRGEVLGRPPYGYHVGPRRRLELVPEEAVVVRYIFRLYLQEGMGIRKIAGQLNEENILTRRGGHWSMVSVRDLLRNRVYLGTYARFGVKVPGSHPALVTADDFRRVQERLQSRNRGERTRTVVPFLLSGLAYCARCGNSMIGVSRRQSWQTRRARPLRRLPLLPVREPHEPEQLWLQHPARERTRDPHRRTARGRFAFGTPRAPGGKRGRVRAGRDDAGRPD